MLSSLRIGFLSTYPPTPCGIATFTEDLVQAIPSSFSPEIIAVSQDDETISYPEEVKFIIQKEKKEDYWQAAEYANKELEAVSIQHEYGIFGGEDGEMVVEFLDRLRKPAITTLHTVLSHPSSGQVAVLQKIIQRSEKVVVMNSLAIPILEDKYQAPSQKLVVIHHGAPSSYSYEKEGQKSALGLSDRIVLSTFGLISRGKGIEYVIQALPEVVHKFPQVVYLIIGATHPRVKAREGESYRNSLEQLVKELNLEEHVIFVNRYLSKEELVKYLVATDIYLTPYLNSQQIVSGTLAYAMRFGKVIISTPYLYAQELIGKDRGILVKFADSQSIKDALFRVLENSAYFRQIEKNAQKFGAKLKWTEVGRDYARLFEEIINQKTVSFSERNQPDFSSKSLLVED